MNLRQAVAAIGSLYRNMTSGGVMQSMSSQLLSPGDSTKRYDRNPLRSAKQRNIPITNKRIVTKMGTKFASVSERFSKHSRSLFMIWDSS